MLSTQYVRQTDRSQQYFDVDTMIRPATYDDAEAIARLWEELVNYHCALDSALPRKSPNGKQIYAQRIVDRLDDIQTCTLVAEEDRQIVGYAVGVVIDLVPDMFIQETAGFIADIYVSPEYRKHGVGRALVETLIIWFRGEGIKHFEWSVAAKNHTGHEFWSAVGGRDVMIRMRAKIGVED